MINTKGGYNIIDLSSIALQEKEETAIIIKDKGILNQLMTLYPYSLADKQLKPIYLRYKFNNGFHVLLASLSNIYEGVLIEAVAKDYTIKLQVNYEKLVDEDEIETIIISSATYELVFNDSTIEELIYENLFIENIKDEYGHERFIEGDITFPNLPEGLTAPFAKWSLSGSHLMIVVCFTAESGVSTSISSVNIQGLPQWILDKIIPVFGTYVETHGYQNMLADDTSVGGTILNNLSKPDDTHLQFAYYIQSPTTKKCSIRITFDLLID